MKPALLTTAISCICVLSAPSAGADWFDSELGLCVRKSGRMVQLFPPSAPPGQEGRGFTHQAVNPGRDPTGSPTTTPYAVSTAATVAQLTLRSITIDLDADFRDGAYNQRQKQWRFIRAGTRSSGHAGQYEYTEVSSRTDVAAYVNGTEIARFGYSSSSTGDRRTWRHNFFPALVYRGAVTLGARSWGTGVDPESSVWLHGDVEQVMPDPSGVLSADRDSFSQGSKPVVRWEVLK